MSISRKTKTSLLAIFFEAKAEKSWSGNLLREYLKDLKTNHGGADINANYSKKDDIRNKIIPWIEAYDPNLVVFKKYHQAYEKYRHKVVSIYKISDSIRELKESINAEYKNNEYNFEAADSNDFEVVASTSNDDVVEVQFGKKSSKFTMITIKKEDVDANTWKDLAKLAKTHGTLQQILLKVEMGFRTIANVTIDYSNNHIYASTDSGKYFDDDTQSEDIAENRIIEALEKIVSPVTDKYKSITEDIIENNSIFPEMTNNFHAEESDNLLFIPYKFAFSYDAVSDDEDTYNLAEDVRNHIKSFSFNNALKSVKEYFDENQSLANFLVDRKQWDAEASAKILMTIKGVEEAKQTGFAYFVFFIENDLVHGFRISFEPGNKRIRFEGKDIKEKHYEIVMDKVRHILSK